MGRPSIFTPELGASICERIALGESLRKITADDDMPAERTVHQWLSQDDSFRSKYARAREQQADTMDDRILDTANRVEAGALEPHAAKVVIGALQWRASKLKPKVYGERQTVEHEGEVRHYVVEVPAQAGDTSLWLSQLSSGVRSPDPK